MKQIDVLRGQHDTALAMAHRLLELVDNYKPGHSAYPILMQVNRLFGMLRAHFAQEDAVVYSALAASRNPRKARTAKAFAREMGGLATDLEDFTRHWCCSAAIASGFDEFRISVNALVLAIAARIERENRFLLPLAEEEEALPPQRDAA